MKKFLLAGAAALLSLVIVSCDIIPGNADNGTEPQYTEDGRQLVSLTLNVDGGNRALTTDLAKNGVDFYEAVFFSGTTPYRTSWHKGQIGRILLPTGDYAGPTKAMLFAGKYSDLTLLATGILSTGTSIVNANTGSITFELTALTSGVTTNATTSSFLITGPDLSTATPPDINYATTGTIPETYLDGYSGVKIPIFKLPKGAAATATFKVEGLTVTGANILVSPIVSLPVSVGVAPETNPSDKIGSVEVSATIPTPAAGAPVGATLTMSINIAAVTLPAGKDGALSRLQIALPVTAIAPVATTNGLTWYIRGGLNNYNMDLGATTNSTGGSILLGIGAVSSIEIGSTGP